MRIFHLKQRVRRAFDMEKSSFFAPHWQGSFSQPPPQGVGEVPCALCVW